MHTPRIFTTPAMSGYAYSGLSSTAYKDTICSAITSGTLSYAEFLEVLHECVMELRSTFNELRGLGAVFAASADRMEFIESCIDAEKTKSTYLGEKELRELIRHLNNTLYDCATAPCNKDVARFKDPSFLGNGAQLQIAKACGTLVNAIAIANCFAKTVAVQSVSAVGESEKSREFRVSAAAVLSAGLSVKFSALSRCLNSSLSTEEAKRRKAILRVVRHNIELCNKVVELLDPNIPNVFRCRTEICLRGVLSAIESSSTACEDMVRDNESAQHRLIFAKAAMRYFAHNLCRYRVGLEHMLLNNVPSVRGVI